MKPVNWISTEERLPEENRNVVVLLDYTTPVNGKSVDFKDIALMYRKNETWYFRGSNTEYHGKYITYWLDIQVA